MTDRNPINPGRVRLDPVVGMPNIYDMTLEDGATVQGTPLNKNTFLKDATVSKLGLTGSDPTVDDALNAVADHGVGRSFYGKSVIIDGDTFVGNEGSEIFNDYRYTDIGSGCVAIGSYSHAEGSLSCALGEISHAQGQLCNAVGALSHAGGYSSEAEGYASFSQGNLCKARGNSSASIGAYSVANERFSIAIGDECNANVERSYCFGYGITINAYGCVGVGSNNVIRSTVDSAGDRFVVGCGQSPISSRANALRVTSTDVYGGSYNSSGADYAEYFEWEDGNPDNEDRVGLFVTLNGKYIRIANSDDDFILGIVSGDPSVIGDAHDDQWHDMYERDIYGRVIYGNIIIPERKDDDGNVIESERTVYGPLINKDYDHTVEYTPRSHRPEWDAVGMMGKLVVEDDGSCKQNHWCKPNNNGVATNSTKKTNFRVMERLDDTHIRVLVV